MLAGLAGWMNRLLCHVMVHVTMIVFPLMMVCPVSCLVFVVGSR